MNYRNAINQSAQNQGSTSQAAQIYQRSVNSNYINSFGNTSPSQALQKIQQNEKNMNNTSGSNPISNAPWTQNFRKDNNNPQLAPSFGSNQLQPNAGISLREGLRQRYQSPLANKAIGGENRNQSGTHLAGNNGNMTNNNGRFLQSLNTNMNQSQAQKNTNSTTIQSNASRLGKLQLGDSNRLRLQTINNTHNVVNNIQRIGSNTNVYPQQQSSIQSNNLATSPFHPSSLREQSCKYIKYLRQSTPSISNLDIFLNYLFNYLINNTANLNVVQVIDIFVKELLFYSQNLQNYLNEQKYKYLRQYNYSKDQEEQIIRNYNEYCQLKVLLEGFQYCIQTKLMNNSQDNHQNQERGKMLGFASDVYLFLTKMYEKRRDQLYNIFHSQLDNIQNLNQVIEQKQQDVINHFSNNQFDQGISYSSPLYPIEVTGQSMAMQMAEYNTYPNINQLFNTHDNSKEAMNSYLIQLQIMKTEVERLQLKKEIQRQEHLWYEKKEYYDIGRIDDFLYSNKQNRRKRYQSPESCIIIKINNTDSEQRKNDKMSNCPSVSSSSKLTGKTSRMAKTKKLSQDYNFVKFNVVFKLQNNRQDFVFKVLEGTLKIKIQKSVSPLRSPLRQEKGLQLQKAQDYIEKYIQTHYSKLLIKGYKTKSQCYGKVKGNQQSTIKLTFTSFIQHQEGYVFNFDEIIEEDNMLALRGMMIKNSFGIMKWHDKVFIYDVDFKDGFQITNNCFSCEHPALNRNCQVTFYNFPDYIVNDKDLMSNPSSLYEKLKRRIQKYSNGQSKLVKLDYANKKYTIGLTHLFDSQDLEEVNEEQSKRQQKRKSEMICSLGELQQMMMSEGIIEFKIQGQPSSIQSFDMSKIQSVAESLLDEQELPVMSKKGLRSL